MKAIPTQPGRRFLSALGFLILTCTATLFAQSAAFISFDAPDAAKGELHGTTATCISVSGIIAGNYSDTTAHSHGFLRDLSGKITEFDVSGIFEPVVTGVNSRGQVVGYGIGSNALIHGFLRNVDGSSSVIDPPSSIETVLTAINDSGQIAGWYEDHSQFAHSFLRDASGSFTIFDDPDAVQGVQLGTTARAINARGAIAGSYVDKNTGIVQAFIRDTQGNFTNFVPTSDTVSVYPTGINLSGEVTGYYFTDALGPEHAFVRDSAGNVTLIDKTVAKDTLTLGINDGGTIFGQWDLGFGYVEGFRRDASGKMTGISIPNNRGTRPLAINNKGRITGSYASQDSTYHGFVE